MKDLDQLELLGNISRKKRLIEVLPPSSRAELESQAQWPLLSTVYCSQRS